MLILTIVELLQQQWVKWKSTPDVTPPRNENEWLAIIVTGEFIVLLAVLQRVVRERLTPGFPNIKLNEFYWYMITIYFHGMFIHYLGYFRDGI